MDFHTSSGVASESLINALLRDNSGWAHAVLGESYGMPEYIRTAFLSGAASWQIKNNKTICITLQGSP